MGSNKNIHGGYPGLAFTCKQISEYIPKCKLYVEPFAGLGRFTKHIKSDKIILNDKSVYAFNYLKKHYSHHIITNMDFVDCIKKYDSKDTFFLIDPPWSNELYGNDRLSFCDRKVDDYYQIVLDLMNKSESYFFICGENYKHFKGYDKFFSIRIIANRGKIFGKRANTKVYSNKPFIRHQQMVLTL